MAALQCWLQVYYLDFYYHLQTQIIMNRNILIITGGTGGHVIPAVNFYNYVKNRNNKVYLLTDYRGSKYINDINENKIFKIYSSHLSGNLYFKLKSIIKLVAGFIQSLFIFIRLKPKTIISFGSYSSSMPLLCFLLFKFFLGLHYIFMNKIQ